MDPDWLLRWANRRRQSAAHVPCARCRLRPVGPGRRQGPAAGRGHSSGFTQMTAVKLQVGGTSAALGPGSLIRWAYRRRQSAADVPCVRCRLRPVGPGRRQGPAAGRGYSRSEVWVGSVLRAGPCGELAPIASDYHRPPSGGGAGTPFCPIRGAARPPRPPDCHVRGLSEAWVG